MEYIAAAAMLCVAAIDRFLLKRREIKIGNVYYAGCDGLNHRFALSFSIDQELKESSLIYELRDAENPASVFSGKPRTLEFSRVGGNEEYLLISKKIVKDGTWTLNVKLSSHGSSVNPLYKLLPITSVVSKDFDLGVPTHRRIGKKKGFKCLR